MLETVFNQSIWGDEGFSAILSMKSIPDILKIISRDTSPPLWNIFEHLLFRYLGAEEIYIRGLSFAFFFATVIFTYKIGSFLFSRKTGFLAAILTFLNPFFFTYAFEGRMYSILAAGITASFYFFIKIMWSGQKVKWGDKIGYIIFTLWALYSHHFAIFALFVQGLWFIKELLTGNKDLAFKIFKLFIIVAVFYLPWIYPLYTQTKMVGGGFWLGTPTPTDLRNLIYDYLAEGIKSYPLEIPIIKLALHEFALYLVFLILITHSWRKDIKKTVFLLSWFLVPILSTFIISQAFQSIFFNRYLLYVIPPAMLILASRGTKTTGIFVGALVFTFVTIDYHYFTHPTKKPFSDLATYVLQTKGSDDFLINWNSKSHHLWESKYYKIPSPIYISGGGELPFFVGTALMEEGDVIKKMPEGVQRVGVIISGNLEEINLPGYTQERIATFRNRFSGDSINFVW